MKIVAMVPARMGSKRIKSKNLRFLDGKPLIEHVLGTLSRVQIFDEIYINSESDIFRETAEYYKIKFYKRPEHLSSNTATNDDFVLDFIKNVNGDLLVQLLCTSPFISTEEIINFVKEKFCYKNCRK